jgi:hypothetical protein
LNARRWLSLILGGIALLLVLAWAGRAWLAREVARHYFRDHGIAADISISALGFSGVSGGFALGPAGAPDVSARRIEVRFDPLRWMPYIVEVRLVDPVVRARIGDDGGVTLGSLQPWLDSLPKGGKSEYVSDDLTISLTGLRALLATPAGALELDGDIKLAGNLPVSAALTARPATISYQGHVAQVKAARLSYDAAAGRLMLHAAGNTRDFGATNVVADLSVGGLRWQAVNKDKDINVTASRAQLTVRADSANPGTALDHPALDLTIDGLRLATAGMRAQADVTATLRTGLSVTAPNTGDAILTRAIARNLTQVAVVLQGHFSHADGRLHFTATRPLRVTGGAGGTLVASGFAMDGMIGAMQTRFDATLSGGGLPQVSVRDASLTFGGGRAGGTADLAAAFNYAMLRGARLSGPARLSWQDGAYDVALTRCAAVHLAQFRPSRVMAEAVSATLCPAPGKPLLAGNKDGWVLAALARNAKADLPLAGVHLDQGAARLDFRGMEGAVAVSAARIRDGASPVRFQPVNGSGRLALAKGVWHGTLAVTGKGHAPLADVAITHVMATGKGSAHIAATKLAFDPDHLQPVDLSPLLAAFRKTRGPARFDGDVAWDADGIDSRGALDISGLDFLTPLGTAHGIATKIAFTSLLPPKTAPGQEVKIARIDWTLPFTAVDLKFGFDTQAITVDSLKAGFADGRASVGAFTIKLADPTRIQGAVELNAITLSSLIAATNLGTRVKLEGKVNGHIPFTTGPEGIRITNGHIAADGPGRLSIDRSLWTQGAPATNAVQDFAYQALETLAFDEMTASLNSIAGGRLQVIFHIKGHSDPPKPQVAEVGLGEILDGSALQRSIPLPSGTPIDLTLDTSLNFDELLKSYAQAWSKTLSPAREESEHGAP